MNNWLLSAYLKILELVVDFRQEQESRDNLNKDVDSEVNEDCANHSQTEKVLDLNRINKVCEYEKLIG